MNCDRSAVQLGDDVGAGDRAVNLPGVCAQRKQDQE